MNTPGNTLALKSTRVATLIMMIFSFLAVPMLSRADTMKQSQAPRTITIAAGGSATITVRGFCLDYGKPFPTEQTAAKGLADAKIRQALNYSINRGYTEGNPLQVEQAIWFLRGGQWRNAEHVIGQEIVDNATDANSPNDTGDGTSLAEALSAGRVTVTATFTPQTADAFYGDGEAQITNLTGEELRLFMPIGVTFVVGAGGGAFQDLVAYEIGTGSVQTQTTPQVTAEATAALQATAQPTLTALTTPVAVETATQAPTVAAAPTEVPAATQAPAATETPTTPAPTQNPSTGAGEDALVALILLAMALSFGAIAAGVALRRS
jgi:hypothetical protein